MQKSAENVGSAKHQAHIVTSDEQDMRLDRWFKKRFPGVSQGQIQKFLRTGQIRLDGKRAEAADRLQAGQSLRVPPPFYDVTASGEAKPGLGKVRETKINESRANKLRQLVIFEDDDVIALNKPPGLAVQGGTGLKENLDEALMAFSRDGKTKPKLVHRLDRDTSGVLLVARTDYAARQLTAAFRDRATQKIYWALTLGVPKPERGRIDLALKRSGEVMQPVIENADEDEDAKNAITLYQVMETALKKVAFVALWPITGRTHQLRVHLQYLGTPILGDRLYGGETSEVLPLHELGQGLHLHARQIIIPHPRRGTINVKAPLGVPMKKTWQWFGFDAKAEADFDDA